MTPEDVKNYAEAFQDTVVGLSALIGGGWAFYTFGLRKERYPHIETSAEINVIGRHGGWRIVEIVCILNNKGSARHTMKQIDFDIYGIEAGDDLIERGDGQAHFPHLIKRGTIGAGYGFFIEPSVVAKYSYVAHVPLNAEFLILHCWFDYVGQKAHHSAECTIRLPEIADAAR